MGDRSIVREVLKVLLLAVLVLFSYSNTLRGPFTFDDLHNIQNNPHIRLTRLTLDDIARAGFDSPVANRPVSNISFALNYYFHQYNVMGYHLVNILIHITAGIFLYLFAKTTLRIPALHAKHGHSTWIPFFTSCLWLVHPIQTQSVTFVVQRMTSMAVMFYVLSILLYIRARMAQDKRKRLALAAGCIISGILALGSKEMAATLPLFIFLYEWYFFQDLSRTWLRRSAPYSIGIIALLVLVALIYLEGHPFEKILIGYEDRDFTLTQRLLTESRVIFYYISLLIFPHYSRLNLDYSFSLSNSLIDPITTLLSIVGIIGLIWLAVLMAKKERLLSFCMLWFLGNLVIESSVIPVEIIYEHRAYLPSMLVSLMAVTLTYRYAKPKWLTVGALCAVVMVCSVWSYERNSVWGDEVTLWSDCVKKSPLKARPHNNLGNALARHGELDKAIAHYSEALAIDPDFSMAHNNLGLALAQQGRFKEAISHYTRAIEIDPGFGEAHSNLGAALTSQGKFEEAISHCSKAIRMQPNNAVAHNNLGDALARQGHLHKAIEHFSSALQIEPDYVKASYNLGFVLAQQGRLEEAIGHYTHALKVKPDFALAHNNLGIALARQGRFDEAISHFSEALRIRPDFVEAEKNLRRASRQAQISTEISNPSTGQ